MRTTWWILKISEIGISLITKAGQPIAHLGDKKLHFAELVAN